MNAAGIIACAAALMFAPLNQQANAQCLADVNHDNYVNGTDLTAILSTWGTNGGSAGGDINSDGTVNGIDLAFVLTGWGVCLGPTWATVLEWAPDAAVVTNDTMRNAITASGLPWRVRENAANIEMLLVPAGTFTMGCSASTQYGCGSEESPTHQVTLSAFYIGRYEVTQAQWTAKMGSNPSYFVPSNGYSSDTTKPVESVTWDMIASTGGFMSVTGLRLPTEAEWEYAYRAVTTTAFHSYALSPTEGQPNGFNDDTLLENIAWFNGNSGYESHAVGGKLANGLGLHDMAGNVWEWCQDWYSGTYYASSPLTNPTGSATGTSRLLRGGHFWNSSNVCRASNRDYDQPDDRHSYIGFRVARAPEPQPTITSITPTSGSTAGGTAITITGTSLTGATSVTVGGVAATSVAVVSSTSITAVTPVGTAGAKSVEVTTPGGTATATNAFTYITPVPTITSLSPLFGSTAGGTAITITGTSLTGATSVTVGGVAATSVVVVSSTSITAVTPAGTVGAQSIEVTMPSGSASLASAFTYVVPNGWYIVLEQAPNAAVVTNVTLRSAITASGLPWRVQDTSSGIEMLLVPAGTFTMGCSASTQYGCQPDESPTHQVTLTQAFYMGRYEVTQAQWTAKMGSNPSQFQGSSYPDAANRPVERVSWNMIASGSTSFMSLTGLRLPTEAEWEYTYRAATTTAFHSYAAQPNGFSDDTLLGNIAWYSPAAGSQTHAVGGKLANGLGLHDMAGNVWEWCQDWYGPYSSGSVINPTGPSTGTNRLLRGGDWFYSQGLCRASRRVDYTPDGVVSGNLGFRVVRTPDQPDPAPAISSVSPTSGSTEGGTAITITGSALTGATSVTVGGVAATSVVVVSWTTITAVTPGGTAGAKSVAVTTPNGTATATNAFTYIPVPTWTLLEATPDAAVVTDANLRAAITASGLPWRVRDDGTNIEMLLVPAGTFTMGCSASTQYECVSESPTHQVTLSAFYIGRYEVTQAQWTAKMGSNPSYFVPANGYSSDTTKPVERVSWNMIASGSTSFLYLTGLRLPTEAEWEYAYRAGTTTAFHSYPAQPTGFNDDTLLGNIAWYSGNNGASGSSTYGTKAVGGKVANGLGLHDMAGNVWEWCQDWYGPYSSGSVTNPTGPSTGSSRLSRGGNWFSTSHGCRASYRGVSNPTLASYSFGFRVVRTP